ncbi:MAG: hypothetical protein JNN05_10320, partial [Candidatus Omnitrophica bacterium]|nr:hypothetical protein [Candidatus Omnitrophota bacterium]
MKNLILLVVCLCTLTGCTERNTERVYEEVVIKPEESVAAFTMDPHAGMQMPSAMTGVVSPDANVKWQVPNGWSEIAGGGMRIVSFRNVKEPEAIDVSIVSLSGPAGGLQANLIRWAGQIDLDLQEDSDKLRILTDASTPLKTNTGQSG